MHMDRDRRSLARRTLLKGAAVLPLAALPAMAAAAEPLSGEMFEFRIAVEDARRAGMAFTAAHQRRRDAELRFRAKLPEIPESLRARVRDRWADRLFDPTGREITQENGWQAIHVITSARLREHIADYPRGTLTKHARQLLPIAEAFEAEIRRAGDECDLTAAYDAKDLAEALLERTLSILMPLPAATMAGLAAKLAAIEAYAEGVDEAVSRRGKLGAAGAKWLSDIIADAARVTGGAHV